MLSKPKLILLLIFIIGGFSSVKGNTTIGYCNGEASRSSAFSVEGNVNVSGAIYLPPSYLQPYDGCEITSLRGALASKMNIDRMTIWARTELDGENVAEVEITSKTEPSLAKGWMEADVDTPYRINASEGLYLGITYHQKAAAKAFSLVGTGHENSFFAKLTDDGEWSDTHDNGILSVEASVAGDVNIEYDLALMSAIVDTSSDSENNVVSVMVANNGLKKATGFSLAGIYDNDPGYRYVSEFEITIEPSEKTTVTCRVPRQGDIFSNPLSIILEKINDGDDAISDNNSVKGIVPAIKKVFVEEYTTEACGNCPRVARYLHEVMEESAYIGKVVAVCHHAGYYTDWLTQPCDEEMVEYFNLGFAPAVSYDRYPYFSNGGIFNTPEKSDLRSLFDIALANEPGVKIAIAPTFDPDTRTLEVDINLERCGLSMSDPHLTVYITENEISPRRQSGNDDKTHVHRHVIRAYNSTWGDPITWTGSKFSISYSFDIDPEWNEKNINAVAIVGNVNPENASDNIVDNAEEVRIINTSGIDPTIEDVDVVSTECYSLDGRKVDNGHKGFALKVYHMSDGSTRTSKTMM